MVKTAIVILNWNGKHFLARFLPSVIQNSPVDNCEIWVADNGSTDDSINYLKQTFPAVRLVEFDRNYGFTGGYNRALQQIKAEYYVLLNSDIEVTPNWIEPIIDHLDKNPDTGACQPKIRAYSDKPNFEYAGAAGGFIDRFGFPFCRGRILSSIETDNGQYNEETEVFWATGACMFVRSKLYNDLGGLDEDFFAHMEEIDLCWRMKNMGYRVMVIPQSVIYHVGGGTLPNNNPRKLFLNYRNNLYLLYKNLPVGKFYSTIILRMILDGISAIMYLAKLNFSFFMAVPKAHWEFYRNLGILKNKRRQLEKARKIQFHKECYNHSIVWDYFVKKVRKFSQIDFNI
jgi:GT2 family glycosyltransferase